MVTKSFVHMISFILGPIVKLNTCHISRVCNCCSETMHHLWPRFLCWFLGRLPSLPPTPIPSQERPFLPIFPSTQMLRPLLFSCSALIRAAVTNRWSVRSERLVTAALDDLILRVLASHIDRQLPVLLSSPNLLTETGPIYTPA